MLALVILVELIAAYFYIVSPARKEKKLAPVATPKIPAASLSLNPIAGTYKVGDSFEVAVNLDTDSAKTVGTDLLITYDKTKLEVLDSDLQKEGVQIQIGSLYGTFAINSEKNGKIYFGAIVEPGKAQFSGSGVLATVKFKTKAVGNAPVTIDYDSGKTTESNVTTADSRDILAKVANATFTIVP